VLLFGAATVVGAVMLYYAVGHMFSLVSQPGGPDNPQVSATDGRTRSSNHDCAICLGEATLALETNCGHIYCGNCILEDWIFCIFGESKPRRKEKEEKEREKRRKGLKRKREDNWKEIGKRRFGDEVMPCKQQRAHTVVRESPSSYPIFPRRKGTVQTWQRLSREMLC